MNDDKETNENLKNSLSKRFNFRDFERECKKVFIEKLDDVLQHVKNNSIGNSIRFITNTDLTEIVFEMVDGKYIPHISVESGILRESHSR